MARSVAVYVPGKQVSEAVVVWDDGLSMDVEAMKKLWWIARSPKNDAQSRTGKAEGIDTRLMIGKFGIGKLASYQIGHGLAHLCRVQDRFLLVSVDYREVETKLEAGVAKKYETPIHELEEHEAREWLGAYLAEDARAWKELWNASHWTAAVVHPLRQVDMPPGRLGWVISNSMPLRTDFKATVNDRDIEPRVLRDAFEDWDLGSATLRDSVLASWERGKKSEQVKGTLNPEKAGKPHVAGPALIFPELGPVRARVRLFAKSLNEGAPAEYGRSYGFFLHVRGRLVNLDEATLGFRAPSYGTFYRSQFEIHADALDEDLLADRERLQRNSPRVNELGVLQDGLYMAARRSFEAFDATGPKRQRASRFYLSVIGFTSRDPLTSLLVRHGQSGVAVDLSTARISRNALDESRPLAELDAKGVGFRVNTDHPFIKSIFDRLGTGKKAREGMRAIDLVAVSQLLLFEGHLYDIGLDDAAIENVTGWLEGLYRHWLFATNRQSKRSLPRRFAPPTLEMRTSKSASRPLRIHGISCDTPRGSR